MITERDRLRILLVPVRFYPYMGGVETHVYEVGRRLAQTGIEVTVLSTDVSGQLPAVEELEGMRILRVRAWPTKGDYYFAPAIYRIITQRQWDIVHCQGCHSLVAPLAMFAAWRAGIPYVLTFHRSGHSSRLRNSIRGLQWRMLRPLLARSQKLISIAEFEATFFREQLRLPSEQIVVIRDGAEIPKPAEVIPGETKHGPLILSVGRLERYKGHHRIIAALPLIQKHIPNVRLRIVGKGPYEPTLRKMVGKLGMTDHVEIKSIPSEDRSGMASLVAQSDLVTLLSEYEGSPLAVMEALALKRPVLVAGTSGMQELADRGLVRAIPLRSTPEEVASAVLSQLNQPLVPMNITLPTWDDCAANLLAVYQSVIRRIQCAS